MRRKSTGKTVRETLLQNELDRIRHTYSFRLGLLLTNSFARKPWLIFILPFTFLKMNYQFFKDRRLRDDDGDLDISLDTDEHCLMIITASEDGVLASERSISIAKSWLVLPERKIAVISSNEYLTSMSISGVSHYQIPDPKIHREIPTSEWNETCANVVRGAIETHQPFAVIFDGRYPYRGILNALALSNEQKALWLRPSIVSEELLKKFKPSFDMIIPVDELSADDIGGFSKDSSELHAERKVSNRILVATGNGHQKKQEILNPILSRRFESTIGHVFVFPKNADSGNIAKGSIIHWDALIGQPGFRDLKAAIVCDDLNLISHLCAAGIPTVCLIDARSPITRVKKLNHWAEAGGLFVVQKSDHAGLELFISALLDDSWNKSITRRSDETSISGWELLFDMCQRMVS
jgi:hypothetical protein